MPSEKGGLSGSTSMLLLKLLSEKDMYGYEMIETLLERSNHIFDLKAGTLYPLLHSLESGNLLTSYEHDSSCKTRRYYHITKEGQKELKKKQKEWEEYSGAITHILEAEGNLYEYA